MESKFDRTDQITFATIVIGIAGVTGPLFLPSRFVEAIPENARLIISLASAIAFISAIIFLLWRLGRDLKIARQLLYVAIFSMIMGGTILSISDKPVGQRAMFGAIAGALIGCAASVIVPLTYQSKVEAQTLPSAGGGAERQQGTFLRIGPNASIGNLHVYGNSVYGSTAMMDLQGRINNADVHDNLASLSLPPPVLIQGMTNLSTDSAENLKSSVATLCDELRSACRSPCCIARISSLASRRRCCFTAMAPMAMRYRRV